MEISALPNSQQLTSARLHGDTREAAGRRAAVQISAGAGPVKPIIPPPHGIMDW